MPQPPTVPRVPILTFFDPNKRDQGLIEYFSTETADYVPLDLGVSHPNQRDYPGFRLGLQQAVPNNFGWIRRVYVTDETNPDWWNDQRKFSAESTTHPIFIRSYREPRDTYIPRTKLTPLDTVIKLSLFNAGSGYTPGTFPELTFAGGGGSGATGHAIVAADGSIADLVLDNGGAGYTTAPTFTIDAPPSGITATGTALIQPQTALLVAEEALEYPADSEFFGLYFNVTRVYETLPGPVLTTRSIGQPNLTPEKYRRLVRTVETDQSVSIDYTFPTGLVGDQTQISLQEETIAKARLKIISEIISIGGDALIGGETNEFGALTIYETVVNEGTPIDTGFLVLKSSITPFGNGKAVKITVKYPVDLADRLLHGQNYISSTDIPIPYQERLIPAGTEIGDNRKEITPIDQFKSRVRELDLMAVGRLSTTLIAFPNTTNINFPDVLVSISSLIESSSGNGSDDEPGGFGGFSGAGSWTIRPTSRSTASASMIPELDIRIKQVWAENIPTTNFLFYLPIPVTSADVLSKLSTLLSSAVLPWPKFKPEGVSLVLKGERLSLEANARAYGHIGGSDSSSEYAWNSGQGYSHEASLSLKAVRIPPTIHGVINLTGTVGDTIDISAYAHAATGYFIAGPYIVDAMATSDQSGSVGASVTPGSIPATDGDTTIPTTGLRLHRLNVEPFMYGWARVQASVINFADI